MDVKISKKDMRTVANIVAIRANEMYRKGSQWKQAGNKYLSCVDMGKIANKLLKSVMPEEEFVFNWQKNKKSKK
jgi:hypothetical protein